MLEDQLVGLIVVAMEKSESEEMVHDDGTISQLLWQHLSSQLIFFVLFQFASFPHMVLALNEKVRLLSFQAARACVPGRPHGVKFVSSSLSLLSCMTPHSTTDPLDLDPLPCMMDVFVM